MKQSREPLGRAEKWCLAATLFCGVPLVVAPLWWRAQNADVVVSIPDATLPNPNAYDFDVAASQKIVGDRQLSYAFSPYRNGDSIPAMPSSAATRPSPANGPAPMQHRGYTTAEKLWLLKQNAPALQTLRKGFAFRYLQPPTRADYNAAYQQGAESHYAAFRNLGRVLVLETELQKARGDWNGALNSCLDGVRLGTDVARGAPLMGTLIGQTIENMTRGRAWPAIAHLSVAQARRAQRRLQLLQNTRVPFTDTLQQEKWTIQYQMLLAFRDPNWRNTFGRDNGNASDSSTRLRLMFISKQDIIDRIGRAFDAQIAQARLPYSRQKPSALIQTDALDAILGVGDWTNFGASTTGRQTQDALLSTALALHAFRLERGFYPPTLKELVPKYLKKLPLDPFADNQTLHYKPKPLRYISDIRQVPTGRMIPNTAPNAWPPGAPGAPLPVNPALSGKPAPVPETKPQFEYSNWLYTLYSVGTDGKDGGGKPIENNNTTSARFRYNTGSDSSGDIVAGVNTG